MKPDNYLEARVLTAPPHRLHLMLIEGALRQGRKAEEALRCGDATGASAPLMRLIDIVGEMLASVRQKKSGLNRKIADFYWFLFRRVSEAKIHDDLAKLSDALSLLEYERQTWQLVCERLESEVPDAGPAARTSHSGKAQTLSLEA